MVQFLIKVVVNAVAVWVATVIVPGVTVGDGDATTGDKVLTLLLIGLIFGVVNAIIKPIVQILAIPFYILTLGLVAFVINALMLVLVEWLAGEFGLSFEIDDFFWSAILAAIVVSIVGMALNLVLPDD